MFKIGDRVRNIQDLPEGDVDFFMVRKTGTVVEYEIMYPYVVEYDEPFPESHEDLNNRALHTEDELELL